MLALPGEWDKDDKGEDPFLSQSLQCFGRIRQLGTFVNPLVLTKLFFGCILIICNNQLRHHGKLNPRLDVEVVLGKILFVSHFHQREARLLHNLGVRQLGLFNLLPDWIGAVGPTTGNVAEVANEVVVWARESLSS